MDADHPLIGEPNVHTTSLETYRDLFPADPGACLIEGTTHYLFQETARKHLGQMESKPLILAVLRDPVERVWSSFQYTRNNLARMDSTLSFGQYVNWILCGKGERVADYVNDVRSAYVLARDLEYSVYVKHLLPWRKAVGAERLTVVTFQALTSDSKTICRRLALQLRVDEGFYDDWNFEQRNATYRPALRYLQALARTVNQKIPDGPVKQIAKQIYKKVATIPGAPDRTEEDEHALERLREYYTPYNRRLANEFDVDVAEWA